MHLRVIAKTLRKTLDIKLISHELCFKLQGMNFYKNAKHVMLFYPLKYEIDTLELLNDNKKFYLPKIDNKNILVCPYTSEFTVSEYNIKEPCSKPVNPEILDLIIVPALMTDENNFRLGYGGGFYDRFLQKYNNITTVTLIPAELITAKLPHNKFDIPVKHVISI